MGNVCSSCFGERSDSSQILTPDIQDRRQQMAEAAERRIQEQERKGIKDPERVKRNQQRAAEVDRMQNENSGGMSLRWAQD